VAGESAQPDAEDFALAGIPVLGDQCCDLARGIVVFVGERSDGLQECPCDAFGDCARGSGQREDELVKVPGFDKVESALAGDGCVSDDLAHLFQRQGVGEIQDGKALSAGFIVAVAFEQLTYPRRRELGVVFLQEARGFFPRWGRYPGLKQLGVSMRGSTRSKNGIKVVTVNVG
jgi:hypothetical protein